MISSSRHTPKTTFHLPDPVRLMSYHDGNHSYDEGVNNIPTTTLSSASNIKSNNTTSTNVNMTTTTNNPLNPTTSTSSTSTAPFSTLPNFIAVSEDADSFYDSSETTQTQEDDFAVGQCREWTPQLTKIVATIGPTSEQFHVLQPLVRAGMRIMRLNFSHATVEEVELRVKNLKACKGRHNTAFPNRLSTSHNLRATLLDTRGPEIRTGKLRNDHSGKESMTLESGDKITLHTNTHWEEVGSTSSDLFIDYPKLHLSVTPGSKILLDDGAVILTVEQIKGGTNIDGKVICNIDNSGDLRSRAGVNLPGVETDLPAITEKDKNDIRYGLTKDIDYIAASFIQNAEGVREIRRYVHDTMVNDLGMDPSSPPPLIISKIESIAGLKNFDEILNESDGIMVARGDLGVEIPIQQVTNAQKEMVAACNAVGKPVIVATQMLESMAKNPRPTRAEVADVTNAVYDGADAVMLSGETAKGKYPVETVKMMNEIILGAEHFQQARPELMNSRRPAMTGFDSLSAVAKSAVMAAEDTNAKAIIVATVQKDLPRLVASFRPNMPIIAFCPSEKLARQLIIHRGVHPVVGLQGMSIHKRPAVAIRDAKAMGFVKEGDNVVVVSVDGTDQGMGLCAVMKIATVPANDEETDKKQEQQRAEVFPPCT